MWGAVFIFHLPPSRPLLLFLSSLAVRLVLWISGDGLFPSLDPGTAFSSSSSWHSTSTEQRECPSTDPMTNIPGSDAVWKKWTTAQISAENKQKRSSSLSRHHPTQPLNPFFLSRRAREQGILAKESGDQKSFAVDEALNDLEVEIAPVLPTSTYSSASLVFRRRLSLTLQLAQKERPAKCKDDSRGHRSLRKG